MDRFKIIIDGKEIISEDFDAEVIPTIEENLKQGKYIDKYSNTDEFAAIYDIKSR